MRVPPWSFYRWSVVRQEIEQGVQVSKAHQRHSHWDAAGKGVAHLNGESFEVLHGVSFELMSRFESMSSPLAPVAWQARQHVRDHALRHGACT